jgi:hypothetical protein
VLAVPGPLHPDVIGHAHGELAGGYCLGEGITDGERKLFGGHPEILARDTPGAVRPPLGQRSGLAIRGGDQAWRSDGGLRRVATDQGPDLGDQLIGVERLGHELVDGRPLSLGAVLVLS